MNLHRDQRGQILPLVFFLGIAFFTSVVLVINTGRTTVRRIQAQNAVDAAAVSGATAVARGMNYVSANNITISKALALVVVLRSFEPAFEAAETTLTIWEAFAKSLHGAANSPWTAWLHGVATGIEIKCKFERGIIEVAGPIIQALVDALDGDNEDGFLWKLIEALDSLGDAIVHATPVLAQLTTHEVFSRNVVPQEGQAWMLPLYPAMPACEGVFGDFYDYTRKWTESMAEPVYTVGWIALTLSLFPVWYRASLEIQLRKLFTGEESEIVVDHPSIPDPEELEKQLAEISQGMREVRDARTVLMDQLLDLGKNVGLDVSAESTKTGQTKSEMADAVERLERPPADPEEGYTQADRDRQEQAQEDLTRLENERTKDFDALAERVDDRIPSLPTQEKIDWARTRLDGVDPKGIRTAWGEQNDKLEKLQEDLAKVDIEGMIGSGLDEGGGEPPEGFEESKGLPGKPDNIQDDEDKPHPWILDPTNYPHAFTFAVIAWRDLQKPITSTFRDRQYFARPMATGFTYASARVYNATEADLFTADWRARLVRTHPSLFLNRSPLGELPGECSDSDGGSPISELEQAFDKLGVDLPDAAQLSQVLDEFLGVMSKH